MFNWRFGIALMAMLLAITGGCGYRFGTGGSVPGGITRIYIAAMHNPTRDTGLETLFTNALIEEFGRKTHLKISNRESAEAVLEGKILSLKTRTASRQELRVAQERRVTVELALVLKQADGKILWSSAGITAAETYPLAGDVLTTEYRRSQALAVLSHRIAQKALEKLLYASPGSPAK